MTEKTPDLNLGQKIEDEPAVTKEMVIESLKNDPGDVSLYVKWCAAREKEIMKENTTEATLGLNVERAEILVEAGLIDEAIDAFWDAAEQALNEGDDELCDQLKNKAKLIAEKGSL